MKTAQLEVPFSRAATGRTATGVDFASGSLREMGKGNAVDMETGAVGFDVAGWDLRLDAGGVFAAYNAIANAGPARFLRQVPSTGDRLSLWSLTADVVRGHGYVIRSGDRALFRLRVTEAVHGVHGAHDDPLTGCEIEFAPVR